MKINEPVGASLSNNLKSWNNEISTKSRYTIQMQEQTKPKQNKANVFEERKTQTAGVPFNNIQSAIFSVPVCYSERSSKYLERRRRDETGVEQWDFGCVMAFVHLAPPALCSVCCVVSTSPVGLLLVLSPGGVSVPLLSPSRICLSHTHLLHQHKHAHTNLFVSTHKNANYWVKKGLFAFEWFFFICYSMFQAFLKTSCLITVFQRAFNSKPRQIIIYSSIVV